MNTGILSTLKTQLNDQNQNDECFDPVDHTLSEEDYEAVENSIAESIAEIRSEKPDMHVSSCSWR